MVPWPLVTVNGENSPTALERGVRRASTSHTSFLPRRPAPVLLQSVCYALKKPEGRAMIHSRRDLVKRLAVAPVLTAFSGQLALNAATPAALPDKRSFPFKGIYLNAAFTHPLGSRALAAAQAHLQARTYEADRSWPGVKKNMKACRM